MKSIDILRVIVIIVIIALTVYNIATGWITQSLFLSSSLVVSVFAFLNFLDYYIEKDLMLIRYSMFAFVGMVFGSVSDLLLAGIFYITPDTLINGIIFFAIGHIFYILALRVKSPLLFQIDEEKKRHIITKKLVFVISCILGIIIIVLLTVYSPTDLFLSIAFLGYGIYFITLFGFVLSKWLDEGNRYYPLALSLGFFLFIFSDWLIGYRILRDPNFLSSLVIGVTYISGQLLIHLGTYLLKR